MLKIWKTQQWTYQFLFQSQRKAMPKNVETAAQLHLFHMLAKLCSKSFKQLQQYSNQELPDIQAGFRKDRGTSNRIANMGV